MHNATPGDRLTQHLLAIAQSARLERVRQAAKRAAELRSHVQHARAAAAGCEAWPDLPSAVELLDQGEMPLGWFPTGSPARFPTSALRGITIVVGDPGTGKTTLLSPWADTLAATGHWVFWVDAKNTQADAHVTSLPQLSPAEAALSLAPPPGVALNDWLARVWWCVEHTVYLSSGTRFLRDAETRVRNILPSGRESCLADLEHALSKWPHARGSPKDDQQRTSAIAGLERFLAGDTPLFRVSHMLPWAQRLCIPHGVRLANIMADPARLFTLLVLVGFLEWQAHQAVQDRRVRGVAFLDDARPLVRDLQRTGVSGTDPLQWIFDVGDARGLAIVICVQSLTELPLAMVRAANTIIITGPARADDVRTLGGQLQLTAAQVEYLLHQRPFTGVVYGNRLPYTRAFPIVLSGPSALTPASEAERLRDDRRRQLFISFQPHPWTPLSPFGVPAPTPTPPPSPAPHSVMVSMDAIRALKAVGDAPWLYQDELGARLRVPGPPLIRIRDELTQAGLIKPVDAFRLVIWDVTPAGAHECNLVYPLLRGKGDVAHRFLQARGAVWLKHSCRHVKIEFALPGTGERLDLYGQDPDLIAVEFALSLSNLADVIAKLSRFPGASTIVVADAAAGRQVRKHVAAAATWIGSQPKIMTASQFIAITR